jgi:hypothetical protein
MAQFSISTLFRDTFGFNATEPEPDVNNPVVAAEDQYYGADPNSSTGGKVFLPITLGGVYIPYAWMSIRGRKSIVITPLTDRRGSVKELVNIDDYTISVKGFVYTKQGSFPIDGVKELQTLYERNEALVIENGMTDLVLLTNENGAQDKVIITSLNWLENRGVEHLRAFEMELITDQELTLEVA